MKKNYIKPVAEIESFVAEEIMSVNPENLPSYDGNEGGYYQDTQGYISFRTGDSNVLTGIDYSTFNPNP